MKPALPPPFRLLVLILVLTGLISAKFKAHTARRLLVRSQYASATGSYKSALKQLNKALLIKPDYDTAYYQRGVLKTTLKDINGAIADFSQALRLNPRYSVSYFSRGTLYLQYGYPEKALPDFDAALRLDPRYYDALNNKAIGLNTLGRPLQAQEIYDSLLVVFEQYKRPDQALPAWSPQPPSDSMRTYTALKPRVSRLYFNRSFIKVQMNDLYGALQDLDKALQLSPSDYAAHYQKGEILVRMKQYKAALQAFEKARSLYPAAFIGHINLGKAYAQAGQSRKAIAIFNQAIRRNQQSGEAYFLRGSERLKLNKVDRGYADLLVARGLGFGQAAEKLRDLQGQPQAGNGP
ncbi:MAG: tetratricopeptide repeat protein [Adhaeribacter sp.]